MVVVERWSFFRGYLQGRTEGRAGRGAAWSVKILSTQEFRLLKSEEPFLNIVILKGAPRLNKQKKKLKIFFARRD